MPGTEMNKVTCILRRGIRLKKYPQTVISSVGPFVFANHQMASHKALYV